MPSCDVIIPAFNNEQVIELTLQALVAQIIPAHWTVQILVCDDGSTDATIRVAKKLLSAQTWPWQILEHASTGPAAARNRGVRVARGDLIFFLNADIILRAGALAAHLQWHETHPAPEAAGLGYLLWDPHIQPTPLMEWLIHGGPQNDFDALLGRELAPANDYFTAAQVSLKRQFLDNHVFAEEFKQYGWEDTELGRRLATQGLQLYLIPQALGWHHHAYSAAQVAQRQWLVGFGLSIYQKLHPEVALLPSSSFNRRGKHGLLTYTGGAAVLNWVVQWVAPRWSWPWLFQMWTSYWFWQGVWARKRLN